MKEFSEDVKLKCLLWSGRHCGVCGKACGLDIEVAHIDQTGENNQDNAIPVCFKCHADMGRYFDEHPRGSKYKFKELKMLRDQIYDKYTNDLVPTILARFLPVSGQKGINLPKVGFSITPIGRFIPVKARITVRAFLGGKDLGLIYSKKPYYSGKIIWNLNPGLTFNGNFDLPNDCAEKKEEKLQLELRITVIDPYEREHEQLPVCFSYNRTGEYWFLEPTSFEELESNSKKN